MKMGVLSPNMAGFAAQQEFFLNLLKNELTLDAVMQLYLVSHGVHRFILGQSMAKRHFLLDKPFSLARFLLPYGSKQCLRRYLTLQIIPQTLPKKVLGSIGLVFVSLFPGFLRCPRPARLDPPRWSLPSTFLGIRRTAANLGFSSLYNGEIYIYIYITHIYIYIYK